MKRMVFVYEWYQNRGGVSVIPAGPCPDIWPLRIHPPSLAYPGEPDSSVRKMQNSIKIRIVPNFNGAHLHTVISALLQSSIVSSHVKTNWYVLPPPPRLILREFWGGGGQNREMSQQNEFGHFRHTQVFCHVISIRWEQNFFLSSGRSIVCSSLRRL